MTVPEAPTGGSGGAKPGPRRKRGGRVEHDPAQPHLPLQAPPSPERRPEPRARPVPLVRDERFAAGAAAYEVLLSRCPADERVTADLEALGVSPALTKSEGLGAIYPGEHANAVLRDLRRELGDAALLRVPGFVPSPNGSAGLALPVRPLARVDGDEPGPDPASPHHSGAGDVDEAPFALIPYRAEPAAGASGPGPMLAVEVLDLAPGRPAGSVLLGCGTDGRDPRVGGANHLWAPGGKPRSINALTDGLLEALRATSAGVRCGAIRSPRSFDPGAGNRHLPELAALDFAGRRVLYAPGPKRAHARTSNEAANATLARCGASVLVLRKPPYANSDHGFGSFLLSLPEAERPGAFARLFLDPVAHQLVGGPRQRKPAARPAAENANGSGAVRPAPSAESAAAGEAAEPKAGPDALAPMPETLPEEDRARAGIERLAALRARTFAPFRAQLRSSPAMPERGPRPSRRDRSWGNQVAAFVGLSAFSACMLVLAVLSAVFGFLAASTAGTGTLSAEPPADEPLLLVPWFFAAVFEEMGTPMGRFAELVSVGPLAALLALVPALIVALPLALTIADIKRRQRIKRIKLHQGRFFE